MSRPLDGYKVDGREVPGVTSVTSLIGDKTSLLKWYFKGGKSHSHVDPAKRWDPEVEKRRAAAIGTAFHTMIEQHLTLLPENHTPIALPAEDVEIARDCFRRWLSWWETQVVEVIDMEVHFVSRTHGFGGTIDMLGKDIDTGEVVLYDWKSGSKVGEGAVSQVAAYVKLIEENHDFIRRVDRVEIINPPNNISRGEDEPKNGTLDHYIWRRDELEPAWHTFVRALRLYEAQKLNRVLLRSGYQRKRKPKQTQSA